ncbi:TetR/AcrR family transcriptional regulator [Endozoicomonas sp. SM1973]|uniref:TetR/AcrR family transcriptional regulator n=1 Tax=Spartinivicinus marinus TaxID=2994442 RepID=A0A853HX96_9GAMM|nr:TetR/AcrR family transcriptional regulator [Spartinivicinus marinus]MCX4029229.1 TetR/AcrR family transcriptional regulator [Spartinivicinus marinus]NYZ65863.1 TetR/AcrR family transcriptional regulator [Spartinivicinus marinus]
MADITRKQREFKRRENEILETALALFLEKGEDNVTVEMIAETVGIGKGTVYSHFRSKAEIFLRLMLIYEEELASLIQSDEVSSDRGALPRAYFEYRMKHPEKYYLFDRLEQKLTRRNPHPELFRELHRIRASNIARLTELIKARIDDNLLENVPPYFHYCAAWALVHGAVAVYHSAFWQDVIEDKDGFFQFMMDIGMRMGKRGHSKNSRPEESPQSYATREEEQASTASDNNELEVTEADEVLVAG